MLHPAISSFNRPTHGALKTAQQQ